MLHRDWRVEGQIAELVIGHDVGLSRVDDFRDMFARIDFTNPK